MEPEKHKISPLVRFFRFLKMERKEIATIYVYAILQGILYLSLPLGIQAIINLLFGGLISTSIVVLVIIVVSGVIVTGMLQIMQMTVNERIQRRIFTRFALNFAYKIPRLELESVDNYYLPELVNRFFDTASLQKGIAKVLLEFPAAMVQILFGLILLSFYNASFIIFGVGLVALIALILRFSYPRGIRTSIEESNYKYEVGYWLEEVARGVKTFKFVRNQDYPVDRTDSLVSKYLDARADHFQILKIQYWAFVLFKVVITAALLIVGSILVIQQQINLGQFIAAEIVIILLLNSVEKLINNLDVVYDMLTSLEKLSVLLDKPAEESSNVLHRQNLLGKSMKIEARNLSYAFTDNGKKVLHNLNFTFEPGTKVCIFGTQGSGKSSLLKLLTGAYNNYEGQLLFDDLPLADHHLQEFRQRLGVFMSGCNLFSGTLYDNLTIGNRQISVEDIVAAAKLTGLTSFIESSRKGLQTEVDTLGKKLPLTTVNKILLTRTLLSQPDLILLEDCWNGMEASDQALIINTLTSNSATSTLLAVTNDELFAAKCDKVILMHEGEIIAAGSFTEVSRLAEYKNLFHRFSL